MYKNYYFSGPSVIDPKAIKPAYFSLQSFYYMLNATYVTT